MRLIWWTKMSPDVALSPKLNFVCVFNTANNPCRVHHLGKKHNFWSPSSGKGPSINYVSINLAIFSRCVTFFAVWNKFWQTQNAEVSSSDTPPPLNHAYVIFGRPLRSVLNVQLTYHELWTYHEPFHNSYELPFLCSNQTKLNWQYRTQIHLESSLQSYRGKADQRRNF